MEGWFAYDEVPVKLTEEYLKGEKVYDGKLLKVHRDSVQLANGHQEIREVIRHPGAAVIVPCLSDGRYVLVRQFRYALGRETLEFPAGRLDPGEDPLTCAQRELREETGYEAATWNRILLLHPAPGYSDERLWIYRAENLQAGTSNLDADELVQVTSIALDEILDRISRSEITDAKTVAAAFFLKNRM